jgi:hypothetical protein
VESSCERGNELSDSTKCWETIAFKEVSILNFTYFLVSSIGATHQVHASVFFHGHVSYAFLFAGPCPQMSSYGISHRSHDVYGA